MWRITPLPLGAAEPLAVLHAVCFPDEPWDAEALERILGLAGAFVFLGWADDEPVGFVIARHLGDECEILTIGVVPAWRQRRLGHALLHAAGDNATELGAASLVLEVGQHNAAGRKLYAKIGFVQVGRRPAYYRTRTGAEDALIMRCALPIHRH